MGSRTLTAISSGKEEGRIPPIPKQAWNSVIGNVCDYAEDVRCLDPPIDLAPSVTDKKAILANLFHKVGYVTRFSPPDEQDVADTYFCRYDG